MRKIAFNGLAILLGLGVISCVPGDNGRGQILTYTAPGFVKYDKLRADQGKLYETKNTDIKTAFRPVAGGEYFQKILTEIAGGAGPDVFFIRDFDLPVYAEKGVVLPLDDYLSKDEINTFHDSLIRAYTYKGKIYALPGSFSPRVLYYNKEHFKKAGIPEPGLTWTWKDFFEAARALTTKEKGHTKRFGAMLLFEPDEMIRWCFQNGGRFYDKNKNLVFDSPENTETFETLFKWATKDGITPTFAQQRDQGYYELFLSGRASMFIGGRWYVVNFREEKKFKFGIAPVPGKKKKATNLDSHGWAVSRSSKHPKEAVGLVKSLSSPEGNAFMVRVGDSVPIHKAALKEFVHDPLNPEENNLAFVQSLPFAFPASELVHPKINYARQNKVFRDVIEKMFLGQLTAKEAVKSIQKELTVLMSGTVN